MSFIDEGMSLIGYETLGICKQNEPVQEYGSCMEGCDIKSSFWPRFPREWASVRECVSVSGLSGAN